MTTYHRSPGPELAKLQTFGELQEFLQADRRGQNFSSSSRNWADECTGCRRN